MAKVMDRPRSRNDPEVDKLVGLHDVQVGHDYADRGDYLAASKHYQRAIGVYSEAHRNAVGHTRLMHELEKLKELAIEEKREADRKYHMHAQTTHLPRWLSWLVHKVRGTHVIGIFIFAMLFSSPSITGAAIGSGKYSPILGMLLFFAGMASIYLFLLGKLYLLRAIDQY